MKYFNMPPGPVFATDLVERQEALLAPLAAEPIVNFAAERAQVADTRGTGGHGDAWTPVNRTISVTAGRDGVPTVDDNLDADPHAAPRVYPSWRPEQTYVVTRRKLEHPGAAECDRAVAAKFGPVLETMESVTARHYRVYKPEFRPVRQ